MRYAFASALTLGLVVASAGRSAAQFSISAGNAYTGQGFSFTSGGYGSYSSFSSSSGFVNGPGFGAFGVTTPNYYYNPLAQGGYGYGYGNYGLNNYGYNNLGYSGYIPPALPYGRTYYSSGYSGFAPSPYRSNSFNNRPFNYFGNNNYGPGPYRGGYRPFGR